MVASGVRDEVVVFVPIPGSHHWKKCATGDITTWVGETVEVSRGGRATYHGPNQVVIYPIIDLKNPIGKFASKGCASVFTTSRKCCCESLAKIECKSQVRVDQQLDSNGLSLTQSGVWVEVKIASIGIAVKKWITYHGIGGKSLFR